MDDKENNRNARQCTNDSSRYIDPDKVFLDAY